MTRPTALLAAVAALVLAAPAAAGAPSVPFRTVARGDGATSAVTERVTRAIRSERAWRREWERLNGGVAPRPRRYAVDFARSTLVLVTAGRRGSGGHAITVTAIRRRGRTLVVRVLERAPGAGCFSPAVVTAPFHVVRVARTRARVRAVHRRVSEDCRPR